MQLILCAIFYWLTNNTQLIPHIFGDAGLLLYLPFDIYFIVIIGSCGFWGSGIFDNKFCLSNQVLEFVVAIITVLLVYLVIGAATYYLKNKIQNYLVTKRIMKKT